MLNISLNIQIDKVCIYSLVGTTRIKHSRDHAINKKNISEM